MFGSRIVMEVFKKKSSKKREVAAVPLQQKTAVLLIVPRAPCKCALPRQGVETQDIAIFFFFGV